MKRRIDRRSTVDDRRTYHSIEYFTNGGEERRNFVERRKTEELREGWKRISLWSSLDVND